MDALTPEDWRALGLATVAGLSTVIGGVLAVLKKPDNALLAFLLGTAMGVMSTLSVVELWIANGLAHGFFEVTGCVGLGALLFIMVEPFIPTFEDDKHKSDSSGSKGGKVEAPEGASPPSTPLTRAAAARAAAAADAKSFDSAPTSGSGRQRRGAADRPASPDGAPPRRSAHADVAAVAASAAVAAEAARRGGLIRLGLLMAVTMTLHNLPEGFAVAFASFTDFGGVMALAVAVHNIPEGVIVAAPIYAATGSRLQALGTALFSGLSEPLGALIALLFVKPFLTPLRLQYTLAVVGGMMLAVCIMELLPEGRKCGKDGRMLWGFAVGAAFMGATLVFGDAH